MSTGAIPAENRRRACRRASRALWWTVLLGVVSALGAGGAAAQITVTGPDENTVNEGATAVYTVTVEGYITEGPAGELEVTYSLTTPDGAAAGEDQDINRNLATTRLVFDIPANDDDADDARDFFTGSSTIRLPTLHDNDAEDEHFTLQLAVTQTGNRTLFTTADGSVDAVASPPSTAFIIDDDEEQTYVLTLAAGQTPTEGTAFTVDLTASPAHEDGSATLQVNIDKTSGWTLALDNNDNTANPTTVGAGDSAKTTITITQTAGDGNRVTDTVTVSAHTGRAGKSTEAASLSIEVADADADALPAVAAQFVDKDGKKLDQQPASVKEGETVHIAVMPVDKDGKQANAAEKLTIALAPSGSADARDYRLGGAVEVASGANTSGAVALVIGGGDDDVGAETLTFDATVSGESANGAETRTVAAVLSIDIEDATEKKIAPKGTADELQAAVDAAVAAGGGGDGLNPGESFTVMAGDLFTPPAHGYAVGYGASVSGGAVTASTSGGRVEVDAVRAGESTVTVTATATPAASSATVSQSVSNVVEVAFDVTVADLPLTVTLAADPPTVDEGGEVTLTATASRAVTAGDGEVSLALAVVGDATASADAIAIALGETTGTATLTINEDDDHADDTVTVLYQGKGVDGTRRIEIAVTDNDDGPAPGSTVRAADGAAGLIAAAIATAAGDGGWTVGGLVATVDMTALFEADDGADVSYAGMSSDEAVVGTVTTGGTLLALTPMAAGAATITVTATDTAGGGSATVGHDAAVAPQPLAVTVTADTDALDEGGAPATITAAANRPVTADTTLSLTVTGDADAVDAPATLTIESGSKTGTAQVAAVDDPDTADARVQVVVTGPALGTDSVILDFAVTDDDRTVNAKPQAEVTAAFAAAVAAAAGAGADGWLPGAAAATVDMAALFTIETGAAVEYSAQSSAPETVAADAAGPTLTLTPAATGAATITVTATDTAGDADDHATVTADVTVGALPLVVTLSGPADAPHGNLVEGRSYELTATANRPVAAATTVELMRDRAASDAGADDYAAAAITIPAGATSGTTTLTVADDGPGDAGTATPEVLVLFGTIGNLHTNSLTFNLWDAAVPALPVLAHLLLAAALAAGTYRRYPRR